MDSLYREIILDLAQHPQHKGQLSSATHQGQAGNPSCGDKACLHLSLKNGVVQASSWDGEGCAISTASLEVVTEHLVGLSLSELHNLDRTWLLHQLGLESISPGREKCLTLSLQALAALKEVTP